MTGAYNDAVQAAFTNAMIRNGTGVSVLSDLPATTPALLGEVEALANAGLLLP